MMYLKFSNAVIFGVTFSAVVMLTAILWRKILVENGWRDMCSYIRRDWMRSKSRGGLIELTIAFSAIMAGFALRSGTIGLWRAMGADYAKFPSLFAGLGDALLIIGVLCAMRVIGVQDNKINWPWMIAAMFGMTLGLLSLLFPLETKSVEADVTGMIGDCQPTPNRPRQWLSLPTTKGYEGGVDCPKP